MRMATHQKRRLVVMDTQSPRRKESDESVLCSSIRRSHTKISDRSWLLPLLSAEAMVKAEGQCVEAPAAPISIN
eukprot:441126-Ditylum_brightwellii.AAC.1